MAAVIAAVASSTYAVGWAFGYLCMDGLLELPPPLPMLIVFAVGFALAWPVAAVAEKAVRYAFYRPADRRRGR